MSALLNRLTPAKSQYTSTPSKDYTQTRCNYADNYYGDQICVEVKLPKPRINLHVGVQL